MIGFIADGEIHSLSEDLNYILRFVDVKDDTDENISLIKEEFLCKYSNYLMKTENLELPHMIDSHFIYRPHWLSGPLTQNASIALKFKKSNNDHKYYEND